LDYIERRLPLEIAQVYRSQEMGNTDFEILFEEINSSLPGATKKQVEDFAKQVSKLESVKAFFKEFPEDYRLYQDAVDRATKALNYKKP
jgi:hypothetical protein